MRSAQLFRNGNAIRVFRPFWDSSRSQKFGRSSINQKEPDSPLPDPYEGNFSFVDCDQFTKVSIIGAAGRVGRTLSLLLKTCPLIDHLCLFDTDKSVKGIGVDISHIDTKCNVSYVCGMRNIQQALDAPDVVIIAAGCPASPHLMGKKLFDKNAPIIAGLSEACARFCPKACVILITSPINSLLPVVGSVYQIITNKIPSRKLFGLTTLDVVRANTFVAEAVRKDPNSIIVPVIGGTSQETLVPVISQMKPCCKIKRGEMIALTECLKRAEDNLMDCQNCGTRGASSLSTAYAGFRFTSSLLMALKGADNIIECAFVKSDVIPELEYMASPLKLGVRGIEFNYGYPPLSDYELAGLQQSAAALMSDIEMGKAFVANVEETIQRGLIWKRLSEESGKVLDETKPEEKEKLSDLRKRRTEEKKKQEVEKTAETEEDPQPMPLTQEVYSEGVRNWAAQTTLKRFFGTGDVRENCNEITTNSISANLDSADGCREDPSLHGEGKDLVEVSERTAHDEVNASKVYMNCEKRKLLGNSSTNSQSSREYHTMYEENLEEKKLERKLKRQELKRHFGEKPENLLLPMKPDKQTTDLVIKRVAKRSQTSREKRIEWKQNNPREKPYKTLKAAAKQKFRSFNTQKKFTPSAAVTLHLDQQKKEKASKSLDVVLAEAKKKQEESQKVEEHDAEANKSEEEAKEVAEKQLIIQKEKDRYREFILQRLQDLKRENEDLKKRLSKLAEDKRLESVLQTQSDNLELEKTKLKACWLIMSSTMDAFSNFCKKFTLKTDGQLLEDVKEMENLQEEEKQEKEEEDFEDPLEDQQQQQQQQEQQEQQEEEEEEEKTNRVKVKKEKYDEKYFNFLKKLMEDHMENELDNEKKRNRVRK